MFEIALHTLTFMDEPLESVLRHAEELGLDTLDLGALPGPGHARLHEGVSAVDDAERIRAALGDRVRVSAVTADHTDVSAEDPEARLKAIEYLLRALKLADFLGAPVVGISLGQVGVGRTPEESLALAAGSLREVLAGCDLPIRLAVEIHIDDVCNSLPKAHQLLAQVPDERLGFAFDTSLLYYNDIPYDDAFAHLGDRLYHVHLRDATDDTIFAVPGRGNVDFAAFLGHLRRSGYESIASLELFQVEERYGIPTIDACREAMAHLRSALAPQ